MITYNHFYPRYAVVPTIIFSVSVLTGWMLEIEKLPQLYLGLSAMNPMTAIGLIVSAVSVWLLGKSGTRARQIAGFLGALTLVLGLVRYAELFFGLQFNIDLLLFRNAIESANFPARMAAATAVMFIVLGSSLFILNVSERMIFRRMGQILAMTCGFLAFFTLGLFAMRAISLLELPFFFNLAPHTATSFALLSMGILVSFFSPLDIFQNLSIAKKFALSFGVIFALLGTIIFISLSSYNTLDEIAESEADVRQRVSTARLLENNILRINLLLSEYTSVYSQSSLKDLEKYRSLSIQYRTELRELNPNPAVLQALDSFESLLLSRIRLADQIIDAVNTGAPPSETLALRQERAASDNEAASYVKYIVEIEEEELAKTAEGATVLRENLARNTITIIVFILLLIGLVLYMIWRSVGKPLLVLKDVSARIATLDFTHHENTSATGTDEIGQLARAFDEMAEKLKEAYIKLQEAKAKDDAVIASIGDGIAIADEQGKLIYLNKMAQDILGGIANDGRNKSWQATYGVYDVVTQKPYPSDRMPLYLATQGKVVKKIPLLIRNSKHPDGLFIGVTATPIVLNGKSIGGVAIFRDMTEEMAIDKAKTEFVSLASHQLRMPLTTINWYTEVLLAGDAGKLTADQKKYLEDIYTVNQGLVQLVNSLLNVSRLELGTFFIESEPTDLIKRAESAIDEQWPQIKGKEIKLSTSFEKKLPLINADPKLLGIVFQNLLSNAIKYTPKNGKITFSISTDKKEQTALIKVADTGYGIPKNQQDKIFSKLFRADNVKVKETEGTGLGLYIVKSVVEQSGGKIWFESVEGKGSTFFVSLPLKGAKKKK